MVHGLVILLTGFGPFMNITDNPAGRIVGRLKTAVDQLCGDGKSTTSLVLKVKPGTLNSAPIKDKEVILSLGVADGSTAIRIERASRNVYTDPQSGKSTPIDPARPMNEVTWGSFVSTNLEGELHGFRIQLGDEYSAGAYVCNDTYYRAIQTGKRAYFIHIPNIPASSDARLIAALSEVACTLFENK